MVCNDVYMAGTYFWKNGEEQMLDYDDESNDPIAYSVFVK